MNRGTLHHVALTVKDTEVSGKFYDQILSYMGYTRRQVSDEVKQDMKTELLAWVSSAGMVTLRPAKPQHLHSAHERDAPGLNHFAFNAGSREDVDGLHELLVKMGAEILDSPADYIYRPDWYAVYFLDPDGVKVEYAFTTNVT